MTPRKNIISLFRRQGYNEAPVFFSLCPLLQKEYRKRIKSDLDYPEYFKFPWRQIEPLRPLKQTTIDWSSYYNTELHPDTRFDIWGIAHEPGGESSYHMRKMHHPMKSFTSLAQLQDYPFPDFSQISLSHIKQQVKEIHQAGFAAFAEMSCTIWETCWYLRGMEEMMMDMMVEDEKAVFLLDRITDMSCLRAKMFAGSGVDILHLGDDLGMQKSLMMSRQLYCNWLKPRLEKIIKAAKEENPDIIISYHSCGYITPLIPDLIEAGIDVLNPVQPECMDFSEIHSDFGKELSFWGTIGTQTTMPFGSPEEIRKEVFQNLTIAGNKGGLLCAPTHMLEPEVPWQNIEAYIQACSEFCGKNK